MNVHHRFVLKQNPGSLSWRSVVVLGESEMLTIEYKVLDIVDLGGTVDSEGSVSEIMLYLTLSPSGLRLASCCSIGGALDSLGCAFV